MTAVLYVAAAMLGVAALLAVIRIVRGPSALDRVVAMDVLLSCLIGAIGVEAAYGEHGTTLPVLAVLALLGFVGSVAVARFGADVGDDDPDRREEARVLDRLETLRDRRDDGSPGDEGR
jgi:multicomponent Na+:H+ antiporter subunit F